MFVEYDKSFIKALDKMPPGIEERFYNRLFLFRENSTHPLLRNHSVDPAYPGCRSINITGDYRAIFREEDSVVTFLHIGTHSQLYG